MADSGELPESGWRLAGELNHGLEIRGENRKLPLGAIDGKPGNSFTLLAQIFAVLREQASLAIAWRGLQQDERGVDGFCQTGLKARARNELSETWWL